MPSTGEPFTEAMLFGIGGGIGAEYITWSMKSKEDAGYYLRLWYKPLKVTSIADYFIPRVASRIGINLTINQTTSRKKGDQTLIDVLQENKPVILYLSSQSLKNNYTLPYTAFSMGTSLAPCYCPVVYSFDEGTGQLILADRSLHPVTTSIEELAEARAVMKHTIVTIERPDELKDLGKAISAGIRDCCHELLNNRMRNCRVEAFEVWANRLANAKNKQGWLQFSHEKLVNNLITTHSRIKYFLSSEGALRSTYADFLEDAVSIIKKPKLKNVSLLYRDVATQWGEFAESLLPNSSRQFRDLRLTLEQQNSVYLNKGERDQELP